MATGPYGPPPGPPPYDPRIADAGPRLLARIIDALILLVVVVAIQLLVAAAGWTLGHPWYSFDDRDGALSSGLFFLYEWLFLTLRGATPGKSAMRIRVVQSTDRRPIGAGRAAGRTAAYIVMGWICCLGLLDVLWLLWDKPLRQCLHDKLASTVVENA